VRFVWAVAAFVLAALMIGAGIAQRTIFEGPTTESQQIEVSGDAPYVLIDGGVLNSHEGSQTLRVQEDGAIFAAYGRTADMAAWLAKSDYTHVTLADDQIVSDSVAATVTDDTVTDDAATTDDTTTDDTTTGDATTGDDATSADAAALSPVGSDLWLDEFQQDDVLIATLQLPAEMSLLVATDGSAPAPQSLSITWPVHNSTPWAGPLIVGGAIVLAVGIVLYILGVRHARRARGPRRKGLPVPTTEPINVAIESEDKGVISATPDAKKLTRRTRGSRAFIAVPAVAVSALLFTGCSADAWPDLAPSPTPSATPSIVVPEDQGSPVVTQAQAERIVSRVATAVAAADDAMDATAAATRLDGTALAVRETNYVLRGSLSDQTALPAIPDGTLQVVLPEANDEWPRTFFAVAPGTDGGADVMMSVTQQDPWSEYKVTDIAQLTSDTTLKLAPPYVGAIPILPDSPFLTLAPDALAAAYADVLTNADSSEYASLFDTDDDAFIKSLDDNRTTRLATFNETGAETGSLTFSAEGGTAAPVALATLDSGAIVVVTVYDRDSVTPTNSEAVIKLDNNPVVQTLTGVSQSSTGFTTTYADQLFFFVPSQSSKERITLLGYSSSILDAKVIE